MTKEVFIKLRCSDIFKRDMEKLAKKHKKSVSELIRDEMNLKLNKGK